MCFESTTTKLMKLTLFFQQTNLLVMYPFLPKNIELMEIDYLAFLANNRIGFFPIIQEHTSSGNIKRKIISQEIKYSVYWGSLIQNVNYIENNNFRQSLLNTNFNRYPIVNVLKIKKNTTKNNKSLGTEIKLNGILEMDVLFNLSLLFLDPEVRNMLLKDFLVMLTNLPTLDKNDSYFIQSFKLIDHSRFEKCSSLRDTSKIKNNSIKKWGVVFNSIKQIIIEINQKLSDIRLNILFLLYKLLIIVNYYYISINNDYNRMYYFISSCIFELIEEIYELLNNSSKLLLENEKKDLIIKTNKKGIKYFPEKGKYPQKRLLLKDLASIYDEVFSLIDFNDETLEKRSMINVDRNLFIMLDESPYSRINKEASENKKYEQYILNPYVFTFKIDSEFKNNEINNEEIKDLNPNKKYISYAKLFLRLKNLWENY